MQKAASVSDQAAELTMLCGFDVDPAGQITQTSNRIRGLLTQIHPALERVVGPHLDHPAILDLLERYRRRNSFAQPEASWPTGSSNVGVGKLPAKSVISRSWLLSEPLLTVSQIVDTFAKAKNPSTMRPWMPGTTWD